MTQTPHSSKKLFKPKNKLTKPMKKLTKPSNKPGKPAAKSAKSANQPARPAQALIGPRTVQATIDITKTNIDYVEGLGEAAGFLKITPGSPPIVSPNGDTLLHLLVFLIYTAEGAQLVSDNSPSTATSPEVARADLRAALKLKFPKIGDDRLDDVVDANFAADGYVAALEANDDVKKQAQQAIYAQKLLAILGELHDDAMGHEFSMRW
jgi:hypothetical protein